MAFKPRGLLQGTEVDRRYQTGFIFGPVGGKHLPVASRLTDPVNEVPLRIAGQQAVAAQPRFKPAEDFAHARKVTDNHRLVGLLHPPVIEHGDPQQRERGDGVGAAAGIGPFGEAARYAGLRKGIDRLFGQPGVTRYPIGNQHLQAGIADILQLLPERTVHVGFVRIDKRGAPADLPDAVKLWIAAFEPTDLREGVAGFVHGQIFQRQWLVAGRHLKLQIPPCPPP